MIWYILLVVSLLLNAAANIFIKQGSVQLGEQGFSISRIFLNTPLLIGSALFLVNFGLYILALSKINLSVAYPFIIGGGLLVVALFSVFYLGEQLNTVQLLGMLLLLSGIVLVSTRLG